MFKRRLLLRPRAGVLVSRGRDRVAAAVDRPRARFLSKPRLLPAVDRAGTQLVEKYEQRTQLPSRTDDEVWRYDLHRPFSNSMAQFLPVFERNYVRGNGRQFWFIIEDEKHIPIGTITYFNIDYRLGQVEIGLGLGDKNRWGKGYGPDAIRTLVKYLFSLPGLTRIYAETALANHPSRRAFAKANFVEVNQIYDPRSSGEPWVLLEIRKQRKDYFRE